MSSTAIRAAVATSYLASAIAIVWFASERNALLFLIGSALGLAFVLGNLGFAGSWRNFIVRKEASGMVATLALMALACAVLLVALDRIPDTVGNLAPFGISVVVGAFLFGIGMQLGGGCGSGTLVVAGGGNQHALLVLLFFLPGSVLGTLDLPAWLARPNIGQVVLPDRLGIPAALVLQLLALAAIAAVLARAARRAERGWRPTQRQLTACAVVVALMLATLFFSGQMWSITYGHALWGAKLADLAGLPIAQSEFWSYPGPSEDLANSLLADTTSVMNIGILAGVAAYTLWAGRGGEKQAYSWKQAVAAALGGLLMGYGARLSFGCNIGALLSGTASGSLHAWLWFAAAWIGTYPGLALRSRFGMQN